MEGFEKLDRFKKIFSRFGAAAVDALFPVCCFGCGTEGSWICPECFRSLAFKENQVCLGCKKDNLYGEFCPDCRPNYYLDGVLIAGDYENELLAKAIKNVKYRLVREAAKDLGKYLAAFLVNEANKSKVNALDLKRGRIWEKLEAAGAGPEFFFNPAGALVMPVPLSSKRERWRGFNQAEIIASGAAEKLGLCLDKSSLVRIKHKIPQAKLGGSARRKNIAGCYRWKAGNLEGRSVVLVDDVVTTGATLNECAKTLKSGGAGEVWGLVVAKG